MERKDKPPSIHHAQGTYGSHTSLRSEYPPVSLSSTFLVSYLKNWVAQPSFEHAGKT